MSRRFTGVFALAILAGLSSVPPGRAKPPDLPENLLITVQPIQYLPCEFPIPAEPARAARPACRSVLDNLNRLLEASEELKSARKHAAAGDVADALRCVGRVRTLAPGSHVEQQCDEVLRVLATKAGLGAVLSTEEGQEEGYCGCPCLGAFTRAVHCWLSQARHHVGKLTPTAARDGKKVMVDGLLKAAHLAMAEGRTVKAAELVRQAHSLSPERVEADPLVYKMHLLDELPAARGGEEASEPVKPLPIHPRQHIKKKVTNPDVDEDAVERVDGKNRLTISVGLSRAAKGGDHFASVQFRVDGPDSCHPCVTFGVDAAGRPTLTVRSCCPANGGTWHVSFGGPLPAVWKSAD